MINFSVNFSKDLDLVASKVEALAGASLRPELELLGKRMQRSTMTRFREQRAPSGAAWPRPSGLTLSSRVRGGGGGKVLSDTGALLRSITSRQPVVEGNTVTIGSNLIYAAIHQLGGTIRPKHSKHLAVPVSREAKRAGSARRFLAANSKSGFLFGKKGVYGIGELRGGKRVLHFLLLDEVVVPARPYLGFEEDDRAFISDLLQRRYVRMLKEASS